MSKIKKDCARSPSMEIYTMNFLHKEIEEEKRKNRDTAINKEKINSSEYRKAFDKLGLSNKQSRLIYTEAKSMLEHRSKTLYEDLVYLNIKTGNLLIRKDYNVERRVEATEKMKDMVRKNPFNVISMHNHPSSLPPSSADINSCWKQKYKFGIILGHDGIVLKYKVKDKVRIKAYDILLEKFRKNIYTMDELIEEAEKQGVMLEVLFK